MKVVKHKKKQVGIKMSDVDTVVDYKQKKVPWYRDYLKTMADYTGFTEKELDVIVEERIKQVEIVNDNI